VQDEAPDEGQNDDTSAMTRIGSAVGGGVLAAVVASLPATMRLDGGSMFRAGTGWMALAAVATPITVLFVGVLRRARTGAHVAFGDRIEVVASAVLAWTTLQILFTGFFASLLRKHTHHHGLAGVTFAIGALFCGVFLALLVRRVMTKLATLSVATHRIALVLTALMTFLVIIVAGVRTAPAEDLSTAAGLVDALALAIACGIASSRLLARQRPLAIAGVPTAALVLVIGLASLQGNAPLRDALTKSAPIHGMLLSVFQ
jgi:hypothetical protein